ncbi:MAG: hypothetical protein ABIB71_04510 [Candidatus Woesearchaeota archaeon]
MKTPLMRQSELTKEVLDDIVSIYDNVFEMKKFGGEHDRCNLKEVQGWLNSIGWAEYRFGSKFTMHSKLYISKAAPGLKWWRIKDKSLADDLVEFSFFPNFSASQQEAYGKEADLLENKFNTNISQYLKEKKLAIKLGENVYW